MDDIKPVLTPAERHTLLTRSNHPSIPDRLTYLIEITERAVVEKLSVLADREGRQRNAERLRNAAGIIDVLTSNLNPNHPLRSEATQGAKAAVADLYALADNMDADAQRAEGDGNG